MTGKQFARFASRTLATGAGLAAAGYAAYVGTTWLRYGRVVPVADEDRDPLLDQFMPAYEVAERHHLRVKAPAATTFAALCDVDFEQSPVIRAIFKGRELMLGSKPDLVDRPRGLLALTQTLGWGVLARVPGREVVVGAVTQPWKADVRFTALSPDTFAAFDEPDYVKIVWTLRADPVDTEESIARTETRVLATDASARRKFRRYWSILSPGIVLIRRLALPLVKSDAERRVRGRHETTDRFSLVSTGDLDPEC